MWQLLGTYEYKNKKQIQIQARIKLNQNRYLKWGAQYKNNIKKVQIHMYL